MTRLIALAVAATLASAPAFAADAPVVRVAYADLDLSERADAVALIERIEKAARAYCVAPGYSMRLSVRRCTRETTAELVARVNIPTLRVAYAETR